MKFLAALLICLSLAGCETLFQKADTPVSKTLHPIAQEAQSAINEANILITATANVIGENVKAGITPKDEAATQLSKLRDYAKQVDRAQEAVRLGGDLADVKTQTELIRKALIAFHKEVASKARKP
jgi:hypothetical protein